ncbi:MAG TPA: FAD binding domain-containing protein [Burkholderiales bacterium]|nr:FAD binding domain-containing protein [Burkholderiales bacterium]
MSESHYLQPSVLDDALAALAAAPWAVLAGGTDFYAARVGRPIREAILDISRLTPLRGIAHEAGGWRVGALTTWSDVLRQPLPPLFDGLKQAAREVGGVQTQNAGTVAGNLCNASPAADGVPALMSLSAEVELASTRGVRRLPLTDFVTGNRATQRRPDELVTAILLPARSERARSRFLKLGARRYLVISIAMAAVTLDAGEDGKVAYAGVAVGACSPVARRIPALEARLTGRALNAELADLVRPADLGELSPISDVRGTAEYRREIALTLIRRALQELADE